MRFEVSTYVRGTPEEVYAWWTDYGPAGHQETVGHGLGMTRRTVVSRQGDVIELKEAVLGVPVLKHRVELHPARLAFRETADMYESWWSFERSGEGTRVRREVEVKHRVGKLAPGGLTAWANKRDLDHHAKEYERSHQK